MSIGEYFYRLKYKKDISVLNGINAELDRIEMDTIIRAQLQEIVHFVIDSITNNRSHSFIEVDENVEILDRIRRGVTNDEVAKIKIINELYYYVIEFSILHKKIKYSEERMDEVIQTLENCRNSFSDFLSSPDVETRYPPIVIASTREALNATTTLINEMTRSRENISHIYKLVNSVMLKSIDGQFKVSNKIAILAMTITMLGACISVFGLLSDKIPKRIIESFKKQSIIYEILSKGNIDSSQNDSSEINLYINNSDMMKIINEDILQDSFNTTISKKLDELIPKRIDNNVIVNSKDFIDNNLHIISGQVIVTEPISIKTPFITHIVFFTDFLGDDNEIDDHIKIEDVFRNKVVYDCFKKNVYSNDELLYFIFVACCNDERITNYDSLYSSLNNINNNIAKGTFLFYKNMYQIDSTYNMEVLTDRLNALINTLNIYRNKNKIPSYLNNL